MTSEEARALCAELEAVTARPSCGRSVLLRVRDIEGQFFADPAADGHLLSQLTRVVDALEETFSDLRPEQALTREFQLEGPIHDELERLKAAVAICYGAQRGELRPVAGTVAGPKGMGAGGA